jgi:hypothetical protein
MADQENHSSTTNELEESLNDKPLGVRWYEKPILRFFIVIGILLLAEFFCLFCIALNLLLNWGG